jgi:uncharacterized protein (TIGR02246 family)
MRSLFMRVTKQAQAPAAEEAVRDLYTSILRCWNAGDAGAFAQLFSRSGSVVGFDGSQVDGQESIEAHLAKVFSSHATAAYIGKVREVRLLGQDVVLLRAVAGMVPPGKSNLNPALNTIHTLVAANHSGHWRVELFQSTPAAFHGRPEVTDRLTSELQTELESSRS